MILWSEDKSCTSVAKGRLFKRLVGWLHELWPKEDSAWQMKTWSNAVDGGYQKEFLEFRVLLSLYNWINSIIYNIVYSRFSFWCLEGYYGGWVGDLFSALQSNCGFILLAVGLAVQVVGLFVKTVFNFFRKISFIRRKKSTRGCVSLWIYSFS